MNWIIRQLKQPSTWKGIFLLSGVIGYNVEPALQNQIFIFVTAAIGIIEIYRNEHAPQPVNIQLPPIDLVSTRFQEQDVGSARNAGVSGVDAVHHPVDDQLRQPVRPLHNTSEAADRQWPGHNG